MGPPARTRAPSQLELAVAAPPDAIAGLFLARADVSAATEGHARDPEYELRPIPGGFTLTSDPGAWRPGTRALCEARLAPLPAGTAVQVRFRLHPLTFTAFAFLVVMGFAMVVFQLLVAGPMIAAALLVPFLILLGLLAADRDNLARQQRSLRALVESTLVPLALPQQAAPDAPFRSEPASPRRTVT